MSSNIQRTFWIKDCPVGSGECRWISKLLVEVAPASHLCLLIIWGFDEPITEWENNKGSDGILKLKAFVLQFFFPVLVTKGRSWQKFRRTKQVFGWK
ncbi:hypothetical protein HRI_001318800 [Hibiscus trionum]|uniref:Uncharacterized protein n=1 Tax=Hibiscus trionum TaxID=183268 RepID=A0A9W7HIK3_HIBTR|nr:hypothetical protein HRI_001318800 [Hibiscus trionum]